jgi:hypothetical protein
MNKKNLILSLFSTLMLSSPAYAGAVTAWGAADSFSAAPISKGTYVIDVRMNGGLGLAAGSSFAFAPIANFVAGVWDGVEVGVGGGLNFSALGAATNAVSVESVYPWVRASLPFSTDMIKTGFMVGSLIPVYKSVTPAQPGITGLVDITTGPVTSSLNFGYSRTIGSSVTPAVTDANILSGNVNFTWPVAGLTLFEEQFVNYPVGGSSNGGFRASVIFPFMDNKLTLDINPSILWSQTAAVAAAGTTPAVPAGMAWTFSPNVGASYTF